MTVVGDTKVEGVADGSVCEALDSLSGHIEVGKDRAVTFVVSACEDESLVDEDSVLGDEVDNVGFPDGSIFVKGVQSDLVFDAS